MRISDWSTDVCSSDLAAQERVLRAVLHRPDSFRFRNRATHPTQHHHDYLWLADRRLYHENVCSRTHHLAGAGCPDRKSVVSGKSVLVSVDISGRRMMTNKINNN